MSCNYADGLSPYHDKGLLGLDEKFDSPSLIATKVNLLAKWINKAKHAVIHTGAGISTSSGIPDFRGPNGVWTLQEKGLKPDISTDFNEAIPTPTHMAISKLVESGKVKYVVSQNIDGLHLRSGMPRKYLSELHGNMFTEKCSICSRQFVRDKAVPTVGQKNLGKPCPTFKPNGRPCRGRMHDTILDWEHNLPENDLAMADFHSCLADLSIAIGTTMQIVPSGSLPLYTKKAGGKLVIINLQPTKHDAKADLIIHGYADKVMILLMKQLSLRIPKYTPTKDTTKKCYNSLEWTITDEATAEMKKIYESKCGVKEAKKRLETIIDEDDVPLSARFGGGEKSRKRKSEPDASSSSRASKSSKQIDKDVDVEVVEEVPKSRRGRPKKKPTPSLPSPPPPPPPTARVSTKLYIKKNVTPSKTKYEIIPSRPEKKEKKIEIIHTNDPNATNDLEMICESDDEGPIVFTTNFKRYLYNDNTFKKDDKKEVDSAPDSADNVEVKKVEEVIKSKDYEISEGAVDDKKDIEVIVCRERVDNDEEDKKEDSGEIAEIIKVDDVDALTECRVVENAQIIEAKVADEDVSEVVNDTDAEISGAELHEVGKDDAVNDEVPTDVGDRDGCMEVEKQNESLGDSNEMGNSVDQLNNSNNRVADADSNPCERMEVDSEPQKSDVDVIKDSVAPTILDEPKSSEPEPPSEVPIEILTGVKENNVISAEIPSLPKEAESHAEKNGEFSTADHIVSELDFLCSALPQS